MRTEFCKNFPSSVSNGDDKHWAIEGEMKAPYSIVVEFNAWVGNFERELIGYSMGILDIVQMDDVGHSEKERAMFWKEVFGRDKPIEYEDQYVLKDKYLCERWEGVDDWYQTTFYNVFGREKFVSKESASCLKIYLFEPIKPEWFEQLIINRMYDFFDKKIYKWMHKEDKITALYLIDKDDNVIKHYTYSDVDISGVSQEELSDFYNAKERTMTKAQEKEEEFLKILPDINKTLREVVELLKEAKQYTN